jgi:isoleucyl-tRNA synthetase
MTTPANTKTYKQTLNLPQTPFPMEAKLTANEPPRLAKWQQQRLYERLQQLRKGAEKWVLHDGPPFANGDIHMGHVVDKTLKDVFVRFHAMQGLAAPYVPGWDCHGLPIEHVIQKELGPKLREMSTIDVRQRCHAYAKKYVDIQSRQFQRLGVWGDWDHPYLTMTPNYESHILEVFAAFVDAGLVYKQLKPVHWSIENRTALADAELEYQDRADTSVYVEFPLENEAAVRQRFGLSPDPVRLLVWTTTPWTLPANLGVAVNPNEEYSFATFEKRTLLVAKKLTGLLGSQAQIIKDVSGRDLAGLLYRHPFVNRVGKIVLADYVTTTDGTGLVHTAPGHGEEDYETGVREKLDIYSPVLADGRFDSTVPDWLAGKTVWEANPLIVEKLRENGLLFKEEQVTHSYPHDWRSKRPTIFRATEQWFIAMDKPFALAADDAASKGKTLRDRALNQVGIVEFVPAWGANRLRGMLESRPDWCISRQRAWGLPIPVFYNEKGDALLTGDSVRAVSRYVAAHGSDSWFTASAAELLGDYQPPAGFDKTKLRKESDIFDVWFESGSSWHAVLQQRPELTFPADLYNEGSDQHRGWFQLSLLLSLGLTGRSPFKTVLTHGFIVKPDGTKVSKSDKEYVTATQEIDRHGADVLRLWCCSVDYQGDMPISPAALKEFSDKYRKLRNTIRYLLSNLYDFDPGKDAQPIPPDSLDGWVSDRLDSLIRDVIGAYQSYQLHRAFRLLYDFCAVDVSALYANAMKDRLYCEVPASPLRRRCQTVMHRMVTALVKLLAPMIVFTADEAWEQIATKPTGEGELASVHLAKMPSPSDSSVSAEQRADWELLMELRDEALGQLDRLTRQIGKYKALDAELIYKVDAATRKRLEKWGPDLEDLVGAGCHSFVEVPTGTAPSVELIDRRDKYQACARCWKRRPDIGQDARCPDLSPRDAAAVAAQESKNAG